QKALGLTIPAKLDRLTYAEAIQRYGSDKPDRRFELELVDVMDVFANSEFATFREIAQGEGNRIAALRYPGGAALSRRDFDALTETAKQFGAKGLAYVTLGPDG